MGGFCDFFWKLVSDGKQRNLVLRVSDFCHCDGFLILSVLSVLQYTDDGYSECAEKTEMSEAVDRTDDADLPFYLCTSRLCA